LPVPGGGENGGGEKCRRSSFSATGGLRPPSTRTVQADIHSICRSPENLGDLRVGEAASAQSFDLGLLADVADL